MLRVRIYCMLLLQHYAPNHCHGCSQTPIQAFILKSMSRGAFSLCLGYEWKDSKTIQNSLISVMQLSMCFMLWPQSPACHAYVPPHSWQIQLHFIDQQHTRCGQNSFHNAACGVLRRAHPDVEWQRIGCPAMCLFICPPCLTAYTIRTCQTQPYLQHQKVCIPFCICLLRADVLPALHSARNLSTFRWITFAKEKNATNLHVEKTQLHISSLENKQVEFIHAGRT